MAEEKIKEEQTLHINEDKNLLIKKEKKISGKTESKKIAVIRIRGSIRIKTTIKDTLKMLNLNKVNTCVILKNNPINNGMIRKAKDYVTWGEIDKETETKLKTISNAKKENAFRLGPPKKGFERKGIKKPFVKGGALGYRKDKINELIQRMI